jgi:hypothetical protein
MDENKRIIEINGIKMEIDLRQAKSIDAYKVGDNVKVLIKRYEKQYESHPGVIAGFDNFTERPAIVVAYLDINYNGAELKTVTLTKDSADIELCPMLDNIPFERAKVTDLLNRKITLKEQELEDLRQQKRYFEEHFAHYWNDSKEE